MEDREKLLALAAIGASSPGEITDHIELMVETNQEDPDYGEFPDDITHSAGNGEVTELYESLRTELEE